MKKFGSAISGMRRVSDDIGVFFDRSLTGSINIRVGNPDAIYFEKEWTYPPQSEEIALQTFNLWNGVGEPPDGWVRSYPPYYRRRKPPYFEPESEYESE